MIEDVRILDRTTEIAGPYCTKLFADAGADVVRVEPADGDPLKTYRSGALYEFLNVSKRASASDDLDTLLAQSDLVVTSDPKEAQRLHRDDPRLIVVCITSFGMDGPWSDRPATEFTLQAGCGSTGGRGDPDGPPLAAGGRLGEWITGAYAAVAALAAVGTDPVGRRGRLVDVAMLDCMAITLVTYPSVTASFAGWPDVVGTGRVVEVPSIEPTADGFAVFTTNTVQQFQDFLVMVGREDWLVDKSLVNAKARFARRREFLDGVRRHTAQRTTAELLEEAGLFRIPAGPVLNGATISDFEQFRVRGVLGKSPCGRFRSPRPPYRITVGDGSESTTSEANLASGPTRRKLNGSPSRGLPLEGVRVLDCTAWWAGPSATHALACLGADVIKVESRTRPDPMRTASVRRPSDGDWLEWSPIYHAVNANKRAITLDLSSPEGVEVFERLVARADVVAENYTPRVMEQFGLGWERLHQLNPRLVMVRMPAFGLDGPWRDRTGFAQTMECISGMAWVTGTPNGPPVLVRGACDPLAGMHAVFATLVALRSRAVDGHGRLVEATMIESALNVTAEQIIEWDVTGELIDRGPGQGHGAPEGVYPCSGEDRWVAISVVSDEQWESLRSLLEVTARPAWVGSKGRRVDAIEIDGLLSSWCITRLQDDVVTAMLELGIPAAAVVRDRDIVNNPQLRYRGLFEVEDHPLTGRHELPTMPFRFSDVDQWLSSPAPILGRDNVTVLGEVATKEEMDLLLGDDR